MQAEYRTEELHKNRWGYLDPDSYRLNRTYCISFC
ncbi:hypothetical protein PSAE105876_19925 [Pseudomonas aeruginosa]|jgi:hypothetical protein|nr:hypothetical protein E613_63400 [Pseudomonas aeruginosa]ERV06031.1 hypothetical protein Q071_06036 [Pseudomonas aeruginosa BL17]ERX31851.1 hypothetical protein Q009_04971 [Pseudomonas aeruginosa U2504]OKN84702.1 hypothetical protein AM471_003425 [Pseudomonas aeruginosa]OKO03227.1 hypothetical protein AM479_003327 [Pseudomonas aeruginosa]